METPVRVLVVDDDESFAAMLALCLRRSGFDVRCCCEGRAALQALEAAPCDWLLTDLRMEPQDGFSLARAAKSVVPDLRVAGMSGTPFLAEEVPNVMEAILPKPLIMERLVGLLQGARA